MSAAGATGQTPDALDAPGAPDAAEARSPGSPVAANRDQGLDTDLVVALDLVLGRVNRSIRQALNQAEGDARLTVTQFQCLRAIAAKHGAARTTHLARELQVTAPSMTRTIDSLVERGLVLRQADPADRRTLSLVLTGPGRDLMERYQSEIHDRLRELIAVLSPAQKTRLLAATADLTDMLDADEQRERGGE